MSNEENNDISIGEFSELRKLLHEENMENERRLRSIMIGEECESPTNEVFLKCVGMLKKFFKD